jgi:hypothetical protein
MSVADQVPLLEEGWDDAVAATLVPEQVLDLGDAAPAHSLGLTRLTP